VEGGAKIVGVFRVKNHDFTPKNYIFSNCGGRRENFWGISCEKSRFYAKKSYFFPILGGARAGGAPPSVGTIRQYVEQVLRLCTVLVFPPPFDFVHIYRVKSYPHTLSIQILLYTFEILPWIGNIMHHFFLDHLTQRIR
jgi:hypothetical protein